MFKKGVLVVMWQQKEVLSALVMRQGLTFAWCSCGVHKQAAG